MAAPTPSWSASEASFGYNNLVSDMRGLAIMRETACRWSSTQPIQCSCRVERGTTSGGQREFVPVLARAAVAKPVWREIFMKHPCRKRRFRMANSWPLARMENCSPLGGSGSIGEVARF